MRGKQSRNSDKKTFNFGAVVDAPNQGAEQDFRTLFDTFFF